MSHVDSSRNNHRMLAREAMREIKAHLEYFNELEQSDGLRYDLASRIWLDLADLLKKNLPKRARELLK